MRIAYVNQPWDISSPPSGASLALWNYHVARHLAREAGYEVVVYEKPRAGAAPQERIEDVTYVRVPPSFVDRVAGGVLRRLDRFRPPQRPSFGHALYCAGYARFIARDLRARGCDIIHVHNFSQFIKPIRALNPAATIVLHMHCDWLDQLDAKLIDPRLAQCDVILGCSEHVSNGVRRQFPHHAGKCRTLLNGADTEWFVPAKRDPSLQTKRLLFVGRGSPEKGVHDLLDAFALVVKAYPDARLEILGHVKAAPREFMVAISRDPKVRDLDRFYAKGVEYGEWLRQRMTPEVAERTTFTTSLPQQEVAERVRLADVMVQASLTDACPLPVIEAMACGVPVVGSRCGGIPELVDDGVTGLLAESANPTELAAALIKVLADPAMRQEMGRRGRERAQRLFSWDRIVDGLRTCYRGALECSASPGAESVNEAKEHAFA